MRVIIAAGGTAGHINPAIAIAEEIKKNQPESAILFVGRSDAMEARLVRQAGFEMEHIEIHGFYRKLSLSALVFNIKSAWYALTGSAKARRLFLRFRPDIVIGCGGFISGPVVRKAARMGIPTAIHEQNSFPGVTTKLLAKNVDLIFAANEDAVARIATNAKVVVVGNPLRRDFFSADRTRIRRDWGIGDKVCVVSYGGSNGARTINELAAKLMQLHHKSGQIYHIHATGQYGTQLMPQLLAEYGVSAHNPNLRISEYISDMPQCFAAADLIICRSGALTISELSAAGKASVLVPSPNVAENHQYYNALTLKNAEAALVYLEDGLDLDAAAQEIFRLCRDRQRLKIMGVNARSIAVSNSATRIYDNLLKLLD